jgi:hypothetical protein
VSEDAGVEPRTFATFKEMYVVTVFRNIKIAPKLKVSTNFHDIFDSLTLLFRDISRFICGNTVYAESFTSYCRVIKIESPGEPEKIVNIEKAIIWVCAKGLG